MTLTLASTNHHGTPLVNKVQKENRAFRVLYFGQSCHAAKIFLHLDRLARNEVDCDSILD